KVLDDRRGIVGEPVSAVAIEPSSSLEKSQGKVPVKERHPRDHTPREQCIEESIVEIETLLILCSCPFGKQTGPAQTQAVRMKPEVGHQCHVTLVAMIVVARSLSGVTIVDRSGTPTEH